MNNVLEQDNNSLDTETTFLSVCSNKTRATFKTHAEDLAHVKSEFLSMMSHEIKTPLNAILGYAQLAEIEKDNSLYIKNILSSSEVLINTINDILLFLFSIIE